jgi:hypothetical protein
MFDQVSPGYYENYYGLLSSVAHGRLGATAFRVDDANTRVLVGCHYDEFSATMVLNNLHPLLLGLLHLFPRHFPEYDRRADMQMRQARDEGMGWLKRAFEAHLAEHPRSAQWHRMMRRLIDFEVPTT